jgi:hypothetical protein
MAGNKPGPNKGSGGRPLRGLDTEQEWVEFEKLCHIQCLKEEICAWYGISHDTLESRIKEKYDGRTFTSVWEEKRQGGRISLRRAQWQKALANGGNVALLIWLGKNLLGQSDHPLNPTGEGDIIFVSRIGAGGNVVQEVKKMAEATDLKTFEVTEILQKHIEEKSSTNNKPKRTKRPTTKKK